MFSSHRRRRPSTVRDYRIVADRAQAPALGEAPLDATRAGTSTPSALRSGVGGGARGDDRLAVRGRGAAGGRARVAHLAEPAETSALRGNKKRAKNDRADARHLRELLQAGRLPESWIGPDHILDLRARVRLRHWLVDDRGEWQQRMQAVLYHHGVPKRADLLTRENRAWVSELPLPAAGREQACTALAVIDAIDLRLAPLTASCAATPAANRGARR